MTMAEEFVELAFGLVAVALAAAFGLVRWAALHPKTAAVLGACWLVVEMTR
jgi:hypothetical protein